MKIKIQKYQSSRHWDLLDCQFTEHDMNADERRKHAGGNLRSAVRLSQALPIQGFPRV